MTAFDTMRQFHAREYRARRLVAALMNELSPALPDDRYIRQGVYDALMRTLFAEGVEIITDADRQVLGLPPRGPYGLTADELMAIEQRRLDAMRIPVSMVVPKDPAHDNG